MIGLNCLNKLSVPSSLISLQRLSSQFRRLFPFFRKKPSNARRAPLFEVSRAENFHLSIFYFLLIIFRRLIFDDIILGVGNTKFFVNYVAFAEEQCFQNMSTSSDEITYKSAFCLARFHFFEAKNRNSIAF